MRDVVSDGEFPEGLYSHFERMPVDMLVLQGFEGLIKAFDPGRSPERLLDVGGDIRGRNASSLGMQSLISMPKMIDDGL